MGGRLKKRNTTTPATEHSSNSNVISSGEVIRLASSFVGGWRLDEHIRILCFLTRARDARNKTHGLAGADERLKAAPSPARRKDAFVILRA